MACKDCCGTGERNTPDAKAINYCTCAIGSALLLADNERKAHKARVDYERAAEPLPLRGPEWPHLEVR